MNHHLRWPWRRVLRWVAGVLPLLAALGAEPPTALAPGAPADRKTFDLAAGDAAVQIKEFARQANVEVMFLTEQMAGVKTNAVKGAFAPREALGRMLAGTAFGVIEDPESGALAVKRSKAAEVPPVVPAQNNRGHPAADATVDGATIRLDAYEVTGSHIKRIDGEGPEPVVDYPSSEIERSGALTLGDFMQGLPFNSGTEGTLYNPNGFGAAYARGATTLNPRGLGAQRFLVLINGRRAVTYGAPDSTGASVFDIDSIPIEAVDSVDYLKDGASAIYGSDAITGVVNIKLKQNYSGVSTGLMIGDVLQPGGQGGDPVGRGANLLAGGTADRTSVLVDVNWYEQNGNVIQDYARSKTTDFSSLGSKGDDDSSQSAWPFNVDLTAAQATAAGLPTGAGYYAVNGGAPTAAPTLSQFEYVGTSKSSIADANRYNYAPTSQIVPAQNNWSLLFEGNHDFTDTVSGFIQIVWSDDRTDFLYTPDTINSTSVTVNNASSLSVGANPTYLSIPADNPYNPFGSVLGGSGGAANSFLGRALFGPTRTYDVDSTAGSLLAGLNGTVGDKWNWTSAISSGSDLVAVNANNNIRAMDLQDALDGTLPGFQGSFLNPFGPSANPAMVDRLFVTSNSAAKDTAYDLDLSASGPILSLPGGDVALAVGGEWRREQLDNHADTTNYVVNPTSGSTPFSGSRTVSSAFIEIDAPIAGKYLELQVAGRHDNYSQFGGTTNPKFAAVSSPLKLIKIRGSYSQSFKAPDLGQLYLSPITTYSATNTLDPLNPQVAGSAYPQLQGGNPNLRPEKGKVWYLGGVIDLDPVVKGLSLSIDHFDFGIGNVITTFTNPTQLFTLFPNLVVRGPPTAQAPNGPIQYFDFIPINAAAYYWRGFDLGLHDELPPTPIGKFMVDVATTRITYFGYDAGTGLGPVDKAGLYNNPRWTGNVQGSWSKGAPSASVTMVYKGPYLNNANAAVWGENPIVLFNGTVSYEVPGWRARLTLGCENILNTPPPPNGLASPSDGFDVNTYAAWAVGRFVSFRVKRDF